MRILIVEDNHKIANSIKRGLEQEFFAVDLAFDGENGFNLASTEDYDLIILDWLLPKMNGLEFCTQLRKKQIHTQILMLTARGQIKDKVEGLNSGADDYLVKPFAFDELLARIRALIRRPRKSEKQILRCGDLSLNTLTFEVKRASKTISLSKKEYSLLEYLLRNTDKVLTKDQITSHVWDYDANILPNTVEVYIGYLRSKIDKSFKKKLIKTVRGFGYKLNNK